MQEKFNTKKITIHLKDLTIIEAEDNCTEKHKLFESVEKEMDNFLNNINQIKWVKIPLNPNEIITVRADEIKQIEILLYNKENLEENLRHNSLPPIPEGPEFRTDIEMSLGLRKSIKNLIYKIKGGK